MSNDQLLTLSNGQDTIDLYSWLHFGTKSEGFEALSGILGFGPTGQTNRWFEGAGPGATYRGTRVLARVITLPLWASADDRQGLNDLMSRLSLLLSPDNAPAQLSFGLPDGEVWYCDVVREDGGDFQRRSKDSDNQTFYRTTLSLKSGDPYWTRVRPEGFFLIQDDSGRGLLPYLAELQLSYAGVFGQVTVTNPGDAKAPSYWTFNGPFTKISLISDTGESLVWEGEIEADHKLYIDARFGGTVLDDTGENRYDGLDTSPKFWKIPPKQSTVQVQIEGSARGSLVDGVWVGQTRALCQYWPRRWGVV